MGEVLSIVLTLFSRIFVFQMVVRYVDLFSFDIVGISIDFIFIWDRGSFETINVGTALGEDLFLDNFSD